MSIIRAKKKYRVQSTLVHDINPYGLDQALNNYHYVFTLNFCLHFQKNKLGKETWSIYLSR